MLYRWVRVCLLLLLLAESIMCHMRGHWMLEEVPWWVRFFVCFLHYLLHSLYIVHCVNRIEKYIYIFYTICLPHPIKSNLHTWHGHFCTINRPICVLVTHNHNWIGNISPRGREVCDKRPYKNRKTKKTEQPANAQVWNRRTPIFEFEPILVFLEQISIPLASILTQLSWVSPVKISCFAIDFGKSCLIVSNLSKQQ